MFTCVHSRIVYANRFSRADFLVRIVGALCVGIFLALPASCQVTPFQKTRRINLSKSNGDGEEVISDFEDGFGDWKFTGNCFAPAPTPGANYANVITGYAGSKYLMTSINNRNDSTGEATLSGIVLDKGYLRFKIAGGSDYDTRVEVIVDGKLERYASGNNSLRLKDVCIDLNHCKGKRLDLKIIDESKKHCLIVDDFRLSDVPTANYFKTPQDFGVEPQFIPYCTFFRSPAEWQNGRRLPVGLSPKQFDYAINETYKRMIQPDLDHVPNRSIPTLAKLINSGVEEVMAKQQLQDRPKLLRDWLLAEAICAWVNTHVAPDRTLNDPETGLVDVKRLAIPILTMEQPKTNCSGYARFGQALAKELGLSCYHAVGSIRFFGKPESRHSEVYFDFGNGIFSMADMGNGGASLEGARSFPGKGMGNWNLPKSPLELELFLARFYSYEKLVGPFHDEKYIATNELSMLKMSHDKWKNTDATYLIEPEKQYSNYAAGLAKELSGIPNIKAVLD